MSGADRVPWWLKNRTGFEVTPPPEVRSIPLLSPEAWLDRLRPSGPGRITGPKPVPLPEPPFLSSKGGAQSRSSAKGISTSRLSELLRQDYAPEPAVPRYPPVLGLGYRIPIIPPRQRPALSLAELLGMPELLRGEGSPERPYFVAAPSEFGGIGSRSLPRSDWVNQDTAARQAESDKSSAFGRIGNAAKRAVADLFETPLGLSDASMGGAINRSPEEMQGVGGLIRTFNKVLVQGGSQVLDLAGRAAFAPIVGGIAALTQAAQEAGMSRADARRLERDLHALVVSVGVASGTAFGQGARVPRADRVLAEADARGVLDTAVRNLPREARSGAKQALRDAFREGKEAGAKAAQDQQGSEVAASAAAVRSAATIEQARKPPLSELPAISRTVNPMTVEEFNRLPPTGTVDANRIRTPQGGASENFRPDPVTGEIYNVLDTTNRLRKEPKFADELPPIRIFRHGEVIYTLDHRRLVAHRLAEVRVRYRLATENEVAEELVRKLDPDSDEGMSIKIRIGRKGKTEK